MFTKKHRESLRGLSHQDKVKKLQKLTRVPLQNLKTNIIQSDLQEDDIQIPISMKNIEVNQKEKSQSLEREQKVIKQSKKKPQYDQQKINRSIRAMTKELYSFEKQKQKKKQQQSKNEKPQLPQANISSFTLQEIDLELQKLNRTQQNQSIGDPIKHKRCQSSFYQCDSTQLTEITLDKLNRQNSLKEKIVRKPQLTKRRQLPTQRQTQPIYLDKAPVYQSLKTIQKLQIPQDHTNKRQSSQSNLTKRFSRTKRNTELLNGDNLQDKKLKFNRSCNQKNNVILNVAINKENILNFQQPKKSLLTERLSYQQIPTYETLQTGLKKRKNVGKFFISSYQKPHNQNFSSHNELKIKQTNIKNKQKQNTIMSTKDLQKQKQKIKQQINLFENISEQDLFRLIQSNSSHNLRLDTKDKDFLLNVVKNYRQSVDLLRTFL